MNPSSDHSSKSDNDRATPTNVKSCDEQRLPDPEARVYQKSDHFSVAFSALQEIRRDGDFCDVRIKVDERSFSAHKNILASTIPYFRTMFRNNMVESTKKEITLHDIDAGAMEVLIDFAYSGKLTLTNENVQSIMVGASYLALDKVKDDCAEFLQTLFDPQNILGIRRFADTLSCVQLVDNADRYISKYFREFAQGEEFLELSLEYLKELIGRDDLCISSEHLIFEAVMRWIKHSIESRSDKLAELLSLVKLPLLSPQYLVDHVAEEELIRVSNPCRVLLDKAYSYHLLPERRHMLDKFWCSPRRSFVTGYIYAIGGTSSAPPCIVEVFDPIKGHWETAKAMTILRDRFAVAVLDDKLYTFGGENKNEPLKSSEVFDSVSKTWSVIAPMECTRYGLGTTELDGYLYVCGGHNGRRTLHGVERYCPKTNKWKQMQPMNKCRYQFGVVALQGYIYAVGGHGRSTDLSTVERYDPNSDTWVFVKSMNTCRYALGVAILNEKLYACGGWNNGSKRLLTVEVYDTSLDRWDYVAAMNFSRYNFSLVANMGKLWAIGGVDQCASISEVESYDPEKDEWSFAEPMLFNKGAVRHAVIRTL